MPLAAKVAAILNEPIEQLDSALELLRGANVPDFETSADADAALQHLLMQHINAVHRAVLAIAEEVDRLAEQRHAAPSGSGTADNAR